MHLPRRQQTKAWNKNTWLASGLLLASLGLIVWADAALIVPFKELNVANYGNNFSVYWAGARTVWQGGNPYQATPGSLYPLITAQAGGNLPDCGNSFITGSVAEG